MTQTARIILLIIALLFLLISTYLVVVVYIPRNQAALTAEAGIASPVPPTEVHESQNLARFLTLIVVMVGGVVCSYIFEVAKNAGPTIDVPAELGKMFKSSRFIMALVVAPLIFNSIYATIGLNPQTLGDYLVAFQNGFFWEAILYGISKMQ
jgi:hypothetical protein